jgi:hypothetical protein
VEGYPPTLTATLDRFGAEGWELVSMAPQDIPGGYRVSAYVVCSKRALP